MIDVTERQPRRPRASGYRHVTASLAAAVTVPEVARVAVDEARAAFETDGSAVLLVQGDRLELECSHGLSEAAQGRLALLPLHAPRRSRRRCGDRVARGGGHVSDAASDRDRGRARAGDHERDADADRQRIADPRRGTRPGAGNRASWSALSLSAPVPVAECIRVGHAIYVSDDSGRRSRAAEGTRALACAAADRLGAPARRLALSFAQQLANFAADERDLLEAIAESERGRTGARAALEREHTVAQTLQDSLLPRALPRRPRAGPRRRLRGGTTGLDVGGDFYDAFAIGAGGWGLAIGDVCGKASTPRR